MYIYINVYTYIRAFDKTTSRDESSSFLVLLLERVTRFRRDLSEASRSQPDVCCSRPIATSDPSTLPMVLAL